VTEQYHEERALTVLEQAVITAHQRMLRLAIRDPTLVAASEWLWEFASNPARTSQ
jgi:hypothetical protein